MIVMTKISDHNLIKEFVEQISTSRRQNKNHYWDLQKLIGKIYFKHSDKTRVGEAKEESLKIDLLRSLQQIDLVFQLLTYINYKEDTRSKKHIFLAKQFQKKFKEELKSYLFSYKPVNQKVLEEREKQNVIEKIDSSNRGAINFIYSQLSTRVNDSEKFIEYSTKISNDLTQIFESLFDKSAEQNVLAEQSAFVSKNLKELIIDKIKADSMSLEEIDTDIDPEILDLESLKEKLKELQTKYSNTLVFYYDKELETYITCEELLLKVENVQKYLEQIEISDEKIIPNKVVRTFKGVNNKNLQEFNVEFKQDNERRKKLKENFPKLIQDLFEDSKIANQMLEFIKDAKSTITDFSFLPKEEDWVSIFEKEFTLPKQDNSVSNEDLPKEYTYVDELTPVDSNTKDIKTSQPSVVGGDKISTVSGEPKRSESSSFLNPNDTKPKTEEGNIPNIRDGQVVVRDKEDTGVKVFWIGGNTDSSSQFEFSSQSSFADETILNNEERKGDSDSNTNGIETLGYVNVNGSNVSWGSNISSIFQRGILVLSDVHEFETSKIHIAGDSSSKPEYDGVSLAGYDKEGLESFIKSLFEG